MISTLPALARSKNLPSSGSSREYVFFERQP
jgi:hypothetical protein